MSTQTATPTPQIKVYPHPPQQFNPLTATDKELLVHGIPKQPDATTSPKFKTLWDETFLKQFTPITPQLELQTNAVATPYKIDAGVARLSSGFVASNVTINGKQVINAADPAQMTMATWNVPNPISSAVKSTEPHIAALGYFSSAEVYIITPSTTFAVGTRHNLMADTNKVDTHVYIIHDVSGSYYKLTNFPVLPGDTITCKLCVAGANMAVTIYNYSELCYASFTVPITPGPANANSGYAVIWSVTRPTLTITNPNGTTNIGDASLANFGNIYFDNAQATTSKGVTVPINTAMPTNMVVVNGNSNTVVAAATNEAQYLAKIAFTGSQTAVSVGSTGLIPD